MKKLAAIAALLASASSALAGINFTMYGATAPPTTIGPASLPLTPFTQTTPAATGPQVFSCVLQGARTLNFTYPLWHGWAHPTYIPPAPFGPFTWLAWGHGYTGDIFTTDGTAPPNVTVFPSGGPPLKALVFYMMPGPNGTYSVTVNGSDGGASVSQTFTFQKLNTGSAVGIGFYCTGASTISSITISSTVDFAIGEFLFN